MKTFKAGSKYQMRFVGDSQLITPVEILKRTAKTVKIKVSGEEKTCRVKSYDGSEFILPMGSYSMAPSCYAKRELIEIENS